MKTWITFLNSSPRVICIKRITSKLSCCLEDLNVYWNVSDTVFDNLLVFGELYQPKGYSQVFTLRIWFSLFFLLFSYCFRYFSYSKCKNQTVNWYVVVCRTRNCLTLVFWASNFVFTFTSLTSYVVFCL